MSSSFFFFRPVLAMDSSWAAIDWQSSAPSATSGAELLRCFADSAAAPLANTLPLIAPIGHDQLEQPALVDAFEPSQIVFILPDDRLDNARAMARCKDLRSLGYRLGVDLQSTDSLRRVPLNSFDHIRLTAHHARQEISAADLCYAKDAGFRKIATSVSSYEMFDWLTEKDFDLSDSHFLTSRNPHLGKEPDLTRLKLLKLLNLVKNDGDTREIESIFREEPKLSYNLLRLVNSVAVGARVHISNFSQAIAILGRRQLQRWLQLLIYANNLADGSTPNPLMQMAAARGRQMELLSATIEPKPSIPDLSDNAFMTGLFSLLDVLINLPMSEITKELPMQHEVLEALNTPSQGGILGQLLSAIIAGESGNFEAAEEFYRQAGISPTTHAKAQVTAYYWASRINTQHD